MKTITVDEFKSLGKSGPRRGVPRPGWEAEFDAFLAAVAKRKKAVLWYAYEPIRLVLSHGKAGVRGQTYTPDFLLQWYDGKILAYEVKGYRRQASMNKLKIAAEKFPWITFYLVDKDKAGKWRFKEY